MFPSGPEEPYKRMFVVVTVLCLIARYVNDGWRVVSNIRVVSSTLGLNGVVTGLLYDYP